MKATSPIATIATSGVPVVERHVLPLPLDADMTRALNAILLLGPKRIHGERFASCCIRSFCTQGGARAGITPRA